MYLARIKLFLVDEKGYSKPKEKNLLLQDAVSYTHAETIVHEQMEGENEEWKMVRISEVNFKEVFLAEAAGDFFYKAKVNIFLYDEAKGKEKIQPWVFLVQSCDIKTAYDYVKEQMGAVQDYEIVAIEKSKIEEIIKANKEE